VAVILRPVPFDDDAADDVTGFRPPPHPDDRLWRHPSEVYAAEPAIPVRTHGRLWPWGIAALGTAGVMLAGAGTLVLGVRDRVDGDPQQQAALPALGSLPSPLVEGQSLAPRSREGVTDLAEIARLSDALAPSLVHVEGGAATGSGVVVGEDGLTITSAALVDGLDEVTVTLHDGQRVTGEVKGTDPLTDIAVLDLPGQPAVAAMADPSDVGAGEGVLAMGASAGGGRPATTLGPLSTGHLQLQRTGLPAVDGLLHVNLPAQPEARGGPLVDQHGTVIGITIWTDERSTYATPVDVAAKVADDMLALGRAQHAWLGIHGRDVGEDAGAMVAPEEGGHQILSGEAPTTTAADVAGSVPAGDEGAGVVVVTVDASTPSANVLRPGDVIIALDDQPVASMSDLANAVGMLSPGQAVILTVDRGGDDIVINVTVGERPDDP
jgi:S1-C subfamily serine protease